MHTRQATVARMDVAHGDEGWQVLFRVNDPFRFSRVSRRTAPIPVRPVIAKRGPLQAISSPGGQR